MTFASEVLFFVWLETGCPHPTPIPPPPRLAVHPKLFNQGGEKETEMQESYRDQVEARVRKEKGLAFQYPERITVRALEGRSP